MNKKISLIMVTKNNYPVIKTAIESFKNQTYVNKELIIVFSQSPGNSLQYLQSIKSKNILIYKEPFGGNRYNAINYALSKITGDIFGLLHADDYLYSKNILKNLMLKFSNNIDMIYGGTIFVAQNNVSKILRIWKPIPRYKLNPKFGNLPSHCSIFLRSNKFKKFKYNPKWWISADYDYLLKIFKKQPVIFVYNNFINCMRVGGDSTKIKNFIEIFRQDYQIASKHFKRPLITVVLKKFNKILQYLNK